MLFTSSHLMLTASGEKEKKKHEEELTFFYGLPITKKGFLQKKAN